MRYSRHPIDLAPEIFECPTFNSCTLFLSMRKSINSYEERSRQQTDSDASSWIDKRKFVELIDTCTFHTGITCFLNRTATTTLSKMQIVSIVLHRISLYWSSRLREFLSKFEEILKTNKLFLLSLPSKRKHIFGLEKLKQMQDETISWHFNESHSRRKQKILVRQFERYKQKWLKIIAHWIVYRISCPQRERKRKAQRM